MRVSIVTPSPRGSLQGNRVTAVRWAKRLRELGVEVRVEEQWGGRPCDVLIAIHAVKTRATALEFLRVHPRAPLVVLLAGTDLYGDTTSSASELDLLEIAARIVVLQPLALERLPERWRTKARVILQSAPRCLAPPRVDDAVFGIGVVSHLRAVKDPFLVERAVRGLAPASRVLVSHAGGGLEPGLAEEARELELDNQRWKWLGALRRRATLELLSRMRLVVVPSRAEGGPNVISEAIALEKPVLATRIDGAMGLLGREHPGLFEVGDASGLRGLIERCEGSASFLSELTQASRERMPLFDAERERRAWGDLLGELGVVP